MERNILYKDNEINKLNVLTVSGITLYRGYLDRIAAVDPRISVKEGINLFIDELKRTGQREIKVARLQEEANRWATSQVGEGRESFDSWLSQAEVIFGMIIFPDNLLSRAPKLRWVHVQGAGIDFLPEDILNSSILITNGKGARATPIAEHALALIFAFGKDIPRLMNIKQNRKWERFRPQELQQKIVGIVGLGAVGSEVARLSKCLGMKVIATKRSVTKMEKCTLGVDEIYPAGDLIQLLSKSDFVVISPPLTQETKGMIGENELRAFKPTTYLINVSRGKIVDEAALIKALKEGWIAGAGLDVFDREPLPPESELWGLSNVILSCHMSGSTEKGTERELDLFCENLRRYLAGEQLLNLIDKNRSY
jgi:D-2-hydroxyacid dehydrogenase (NADP+)